MSVVVETPEGIHRLICKGATEAVFQRCSRFELEGKSLSDRSAADHGPEGRMRRAERRRLPRAGDRLPGRASRRRPTRRTTSSDLVLKGYVAFLDPPKDSAAPAILAPEQPRRRGQSAHRRQRTGQPQDLPGSRPGDRSRVAGRTGGSHVRRRAGRGGRTYHALRPALARPQAARSSAPCRARGTSSASWATASTTRRPCGRPTWASPSTPPWTSPRKRPTSSSWKRA